MNQASEGKCPRLFKAPRKSLTGAQQLRVETSAGYSVGAGRHRVGRTVGVHPCDRLACFDLDCRMLEIVDAHEPGTKAGCALSRMPPINRNANSLSGMADAFCDTNGGTFVFHMEKTPIGLSS